MIQFIELSLMEHTYVANTEIKNRTELKLYFLRILLGGLCSQLSEAP